MTDAKDYAELRRRTDAERVLFGEFNNDPMSVTLALLDARDHIDTLTRERDEARRDAARLDWLDTQMDGVHVEAGVAGGEYQMSWFATVYTFCDEFRAGTVREAIDKAMNHARTAALTPGAA